MAALLLPFIIATVNLCIDGKYFCSYCVF